MHPAGISYGTAKQMITRLRRAMRWQTLPLIIGFAILALIVGSRAMLVETQSANRAAARDALEYQQLLASLLSLAQDAETGQRGYLLTGEKSYLEPYQQAVAALPGQLARIDELTVQNSEAVQQVDSIKDALAQKQAELAETIGLYDSGNTTKALDIVRSGRGKAAMDQIRTNMDTIRRVGSATLHAGDAHIEQVERWLRIGSFAALLAIFVLGAYTVRESRRRFREVAVAQDELTRKNAALTTEIQTREKAESQIRQMQKMEAVGQLTGGIAHDFNNMLAVIISAMNLAQRKLARGENDIDKFVEAATDAATRAANLTARLLAFSRQQPLAPQIVDANRLVTGMSELLSRALGEAIRIETVLAGGLWKTHADPSQIENAILNLAVNARDAMGEEGKLTIETANSHLDDSYAATHAEVKAGQYVMIAVTDSGTGMTPEIMAKAFEPFSRPSRSTRAPALASARCSVSSSNQAGTSRFTPSRAKARQSGSTCPASSAMKKPQSPPEPARQSPGRRPRPYWWSKTICTYGSRQPTRCENSVTPSSTQAVLRKHYTNSETIRASRSCSQTLSCR